MLGVYGKRKNDKRFKPFNMKENVFAVNRIHMTIFDTSQYNELKNEIDYMNNHNPDFIFEIREI